MGGFGSGGHNRTGRETVEEHRSIEIGRLRRAGALQPRWSGICEWTRNGERVADIIVHGGHDRIRLLYGARVAGGERQEVDEPVPILWRPCPFGGERPFFACPGCGGATLRLHGAGVRFLCRTCCRLSYASQREREVDRALRRANRLRARLGGEPGISAPIPRRPKYMHARTYSRLADEIFDLELAGEDYAARLLMRLDHRARRPSPRSFWS